MSKKVIRAAFLALAALVAMPTIVLAQGTPIQSQCYTLRFVGYLWTCECGRLICHPHYEIVPITPFVVHEGPRPCPCECQPLFPDEPRDPPRPRPAPRPDPQP